MDNTDEMHNVHDMHDTTQEQMGRADANGPDPAGQAAQAAHTRCWHGRSQGPETRGWTWRSPPGFMPSSSAAAASRPTPPRHPWAQPASSDGHGAHDRIAHRLRGTLYPLFSRVSRDGRIA